MNEQEQEGCGGGPDPKLEEGGAEGGGDSPALPQMRDNKNAISNEETMVHLLKGNVGTGVLAMPEAFLNAGLWVGLAGIPILGLICTHCMHTLLKCSRELCKRTGRSAMSYEETAKVSFSSGPPACRRWASVVGYTITTFLIITQMGFCCVYFVFIPQNFQRAIEGIVGGEVGISNFAFLSIFLVPILLICYIPDLKVLAPVSLVAAVVEAVGLAICFYYMARDLPTGNELPGWGGWAKMPLYFGSAIYAVEGIGLVLPLENSMRTPAAFGGLTGVLNTAMCIVVCLYAAVGFFGYLTCGSNVEGSITLNLPKEDALAQAVQILMGLAVYMSYPLQMYVPYKILMPSVLKKFAPPETTSRHRVRVVEYTFKTCCVLLTFVLAAAIPNIGLFISLVGAVSGSTLAVIFPPIIEVVTFWPDTGRFHYRVIKGLLIGVLGFVGFLTGTVTSVQAIIDFLVNGE